MMMLRSLQGPRSTRTEIRRAYMSEFRRAANPSQGEYGVRNAIIESHRHGDGDDEAFKIYMDAKDGD